MKNLWMIIAALVLTFSSVNADAKEANKSILGIWKFEVENAPYEYQRGKTTFYQEDEITKVKLAFNYESITGSNLKVDGNKVTFEVIVEYERVNVTLNLVDDKLVGEAIMSEGDFTVVMKRDNTPLTTAPSAKK